MKSSRSWAGSDLFCLPTLGPSLKFYKKDAQANKCYRVFQGYSFFKMKMAPKTWALEVRRMEDCLKIDLKIEDAKE